MHVPILCLSLFLAWLLGGPALALTPEECREVSERYGIRAIGCTGDAVDPAPLPAARGPETGVPGLPPDNLRESHIFFARGTELMAGEAQRLALLARVLETEPLRGACLRLVGHSDSAGPADINLDLSRQRAEMIAEYLGQTLADPGRIAEVAAAGEGELLVGYAPEAPENRRVAIHARACR